MQPSALIAVQKDINLKGSHRVPIGRNPSSRTLALVTITSISLSKLLDQLDLCHQRRRVGCVSLMLSFKNHAHAELVLFSLCPGRVVHLFFPRSLYLTSYRSECVWVGNIFEIWFYDNIRCSFWMFAKPMESNLKQFNCMLVVFAFS